MENETPEQWKQRIGVGQRQSRFHQHYGTTKEEIVRREDNGKVGGVYTHRMDGSHDTKIFAPAVNAHARSQEG